jgi:hypothetical protein
MAALPNLPNGSRKINIRARNPYLLKMATLPKWVNRK